jgi:hypothetical protein
MDVTLPVNLGGLERKPDNRDIQLGAVQAPVSIPSTFIPDMTWFVRNYQGQTAFCGEHAGTHFKAIIEHQDSPTTNQRFSPRYGVIKLKTPASPVYDGFGVDAGTTLTAIFKWLQKCGAASYEPLEDNVFLSEAAYVDPSVVTQDIDTDAASHQIASYAFDALTYESLCQAIYQSKAVIILIKCDDGFWGTQTPTFTTPTYGHFVTAYAYDENGIWVIDSADPNIGYVFKHIATEYITPTFFKESGTAVDVPPAVKQALTTAAPIPPSVNQAISAGQLNLAEQILQDIEAALALIKKEL